MLDDEKQKLKHFLLIILGVLIIANLVILDSFLFLKPKSEEMKVSGIINRQTPDLPTAPVAKTKQEEIGKVDYRQICQEEISKALATISAQPSQKVKTVYQQAPQAKQPSILYIPLGGGVATSNRSWSYVGGAEGYFDKNNYKGAKKITFEVFLKVKHGAGEANARLYDATNKVVIANSEVAAGGETFTLKTTSSLNLINGNNLYQVQLRSSTGYEAYMDGARIKIEY